MQNEGDEFFEIKNAMNNNNLQETKKYLINAAHKRDSLNNEIVHLDRIYVAANKKLRNISWIPLGKHLLKKQFKIRSENAAEARIKLNLAIKNYEESKVEINNLIEEPALEHYQLLKKSFEKLSRCSKIEEVIEERIIDRVTTRSAASTIVNREKSEFWLDYTFDDIGFITSKFPAFRFQSNHGADILLFPCFVMIYSSKESFGLYDYSEFKIKANYFDLIEEGELLEDSEISGSTWKYVNKNGARDCRYSYNYEIPIVRYGELILMTNDGFSKEFHVSNARLCVDFGIAYYEYLAKTVDAQKINFETRRPL